MKIFIFLALNLLLTNCNKDEKKIEENKTEIIIENEEKKVKENKTEIIVKNEENKSEAVTVEDKEEYINFNFSDETYKNLEIFSENKKEVIEKLKNLDEEEADKLYDEYYKENKKFCEKIMQGEDFFSFNLDISKEDFKEAKKFFNKYGITVIDTQGGFFLHITSSFYYDIFKDYVSDEYRDYLELTFKDDDVDVGNMPNAMCYFEYNSITPLTIQEIADKIIVFRKFLDKYPDTKFKEIFAVYAFYILDYTRCSLPYREDESGYEVPEDYYKISKENMKEYENFIEKYPDELATECLKYLLKNYKTKKSDIIEENIINIIKKEIKEEFNVTELWNL